MTALQFFHRNLGRFIDRTEGAADSNAISRVYRHPAGKNPMRLGITPDKALIEIGRATIWSTPLPDEPLASAVAHRPTSDMTDREFMARLVRDPPQPPYMAVRFGRNPDSVIANLTVCETTDYVIISGAEMIMFDRAVVLAAIDAARGIDPRAVLDAARIWQGRNADNAKAVDQALGFRYGQLQGLEMAVHLFPTLGLPEADAATQIIRLEGEKG